MVRLVAMAAPVAMVADYEFFFYVIPFPFTAQRTFWSFCSIYTARSTPPFFARIETDPRITEMIFVLHIVEDAGILLMYYIDELGNCSRFGYLELERQ